jgi:putative FmdB family regulatory protein
VPTYEYECEKCRRLFEVRQRITAAALTTCEACGGPVKRLLSSAPFILKGEGWYVTDYPSESRKKAKESEKPAAEKSTSSSSDGAASSTDGSKSATGAASPAAPAKAAPAKAPPAKAAPAKSD